MATLTGAQGVATGQYHAAVVTNSENWEKASVFAGRSSGDLVVLYGAAYFNVFKHSCFFIKVSFVILASSSIYSRAAFPGIF